MNQERIFLSAVSGEVRAARGKLAQTLTGLALPVREQSDFSADRRGLDWAMATITWALRG